MTSQKKIKIVRKEITRIKEHLVTIPKITSFNPLVPKQLDALLI